MPTFNNAAISEEAFEKFFRETFKNACSFCQLRYGFDIDQCKEIVHTSFIRLWQHRHYIGSHISLHAYLYKIINNASLDHYKHLRVKLKHEHAVIQRYTQNTPIEIPEHADLKQLESDIDRAIAELPENMRKIFSLSRLEGLTYNQIAARMGISVKTVETQMSRALVKLRIKLAQYLQAVLITVIIRFIFFMDL